jgi:hypothetical protein
VLLLLLLLQQQQLFASVAYSTAIEQLEGSRLAGADTTGAADSWGHVLKVQPQ